MNRYDAQQICAFLEAIDRHLDASVSLVIIGGGAAILGHGATSATKDIDTFGSDATPLEQAILLARHDLGYGVPIDSADIGDLPLNYEDRVERVMPGLQRLHLCVPERHDLALSKLLRGAEGDLRAIREMHAHRPLIMSTLVSRHLTEMDYSVSGSFNRDLSLFAAVQQLWGTDTALRVSDEVKEYRRVKERRDAALKRPTGRGRGR